MVNPQIWGLTGVLPHIHNLTNSGNNYPNLKEVTNYPEVFPAEKQRLKNERGKIWGLVIMKPQIWAKKEVANISPAPTTNY